MYFTLYSAVQRRTNNLRKFKIISYKLNILTNFEIILEEKYTRRNKQTEMQSGFGDKDQQFKIF